LIALTPDNRTTLDVVERVSVAGRGGVTPSVLLEDVCAAVADAFDFDSVGAVRYDAEAEVVTEIASDPAAAPAGRGDRHWTASISLAQETQSLVLLTAGDVTSAFVLPLISGDRCLAFLCGTREARVSPTEIDEEALATVGVIAATLLEDALAREEMRELDVLKSEFIALAAHELRNPLSSIYGISVTLNEREGELAEQERLALRDALLDQTTRVRTLAEQLLDLSRLDLTAIRISPEPVPLRPKIEELVHSLADGRSNAVTIAVPPDLQAVVDPAALDRMLTNLVANSLRHGKPPVTITAVGEDRHLRLVVEDRGNGVPHEFVPRLFDRFARSTESLGRRDGSGLGLSIAQAYARAHGGEIVYAPAVPHGARFEVVIPLRGYGDEQRPIDARARARRSQT
jgi:signal transduction histidine kinase